MEDWNSVSFSFLATQSNSGCASQLAVHMRIRLDAHLIASRRASEGQTDKSINRRGGWDGAFMTSRNILQTWKISWRQWPIRICPLPSKGCRSIWSQETCSA